MKRYIKPATIVANIRVKQQFLIPLSLGNEYTSTDVSYGKQRSDDEGMPEDQNGWSDGLW